MSVKIKKINGREYWYYDKPGRNGKAKSYYLGPVHPKRKKKRDGLGFVVVGLATLAGKALKGELKDYNNKSTFTPNIPANYAAVARYEINRPIAKDIVGKRAAMEVRMAEQVAADRKANPDKQTFSDKAYKEAMYAPYQESMSNGHLSGMQPSAPSTTASSDKEAPAPSTAPDTPDVDAE